MRGSRLRPSSFRGLNPTLAYSKRILPSQPATPVRAVDVDSSQRLSISCCLDRLVHGRSSSLASASNSLFFNRFKSDRRNILFQAKISLYKLNTVTPQRKRYHDSSRKSTVRMRTTVFIDTAIKSERVKCGPARNVFADICKWIKDIWNSISDIYNCFKDIWICFKDICQILISAYELQISANELQISANQLQISVKDLKISPNICRYLQIFADICKYL